MRTFHAKPSMRNLPCETFHAKPSMRNLPCETFHAKPSMRNLPCETYVGFGILTILKSEFCCDVLFFKTCSSSVHSNISSYFITYLVTHLVLQLFAKYEFNINGVLITIIVFTSLFQLAF